jgi:hypothetical protein
MGPGLSLTEFPADDPERARRFCPFGPARRTVEDPAGAASL